MPNASVAGYCSDILTSFLAIVVRLLSLVSRSLRSTLFTDFPAGYTFDGGHRRPVAGHDVSLFPSQIDPSETPKSSDFQDVDLGRFFGFVGCQRSRKSGRD